MFQDALHEHMTRIFDTERQMTSMSKKQARATDMVKAAQDERMGVRLERRGPPTRRGKGKRLRRTSGK